MIVQRLHESNVVLAGQLVGSTPDYWSGSGLTNRTVSSGLGVHFLIAIVTVGGITVTPFDDITQGNCSGKLDYFLCTCLSANTTIDIHLSPGHYNFTQQSCELSDKNGVTITGSDVVIECNVSGFNIVFMNTTNIKISNITMKGCGGVFSNSVGHTLDQVLPYAYFRNGSRFVLMFIKSSDITISDLTMIDSLSYGILSWSL